MSSSVLTNQLIEANVDRHSSLHVVASNLVKPGRSLTYQELSRFLENSLPRHVSFASGLSISFQRQRSTLQFWRVAIVVDRTYEEIQDSGENHDEYFSSR